MDPSMLLNISRKLVCKMSNGRELHEFDPNLIDAFKSLDLADYQEPSENDTDSSRQAYLATVNENLAAKVVSNSPLTQQDLAAGEFTAILRLAGVRSCDGCLMFPNVASALYNSTGWRGLPINLGITSSTGEFTPITLQQHQIEGLNFIRRREKMSGGCYSYGLRGSIAQLEMGLGKTLLAIAYSLIAPRPPHPERFGENGFPTLVIASKTVMLEWKAEGFEKFFGSNVKVLYYHKTFIPNAFFNNICREDIVGYDFVITTYDVVSAAGKKGSEVEECFERGEEHTLMSGKIVAIHCRTREQANKPAIRGPRILFNTPWERVIADESQRFTNPTSLIYKSMMAVYGLYKLCLTGTPIKNYRTDIWSQLRWCGYTGCVNKTDWKRKGSSLMNTHKLTGAVLQVLTEATDIVLPENFKVYTTVRLTGIERQAYDFVLGTAKRVYDQMMAKMVNFAHVLAIFIRLRQMCIAPYLITQEAKRNRSSKKSGDTLANEYLKQLHTGPLSKWVKDKSGTAGIRSAKMQEIIAVMKKIPKGEKVVVFSSFTSGLDLLNDAIAEFMPEGYQYDQIDGDTPSVMRKRIKDSFCNDDKVSALLLTYSVGSVGLNLTRGNHVICIEPWWTDTTLEQAAKRCHRPGQTRDVYTYNIYVENSIEQRILKICEEKREMAKELLNGAVCARRGGPDKYTLGRILNIYN